MPRIPRCQSRVYPCPAGDRCPQHRGLQAMLDRAAQEMDLEGYAQLQELMNERGAKGRIRHNRKGETLVSLVTPVIAKQVTREMGTKTVTFTTTKPQKQVVNLGKLTTADVVDKDRKIYFEVYKQADITRSIQETYGAEVDMQTSYKHENALIDSVAMPEDFRGKGVAKHLVESFLSQSRQDLRGFGIAEGILSDAELRELDFQPNPFYWAGRTHPVTGYTYPSRKALEAKIYNRDRNDRYEHNYGTTLYRGRDMEAYPYIRTFLFNPPFEMLEWGRKTEMDRDERRVLAAYMGEREERWQARQKELAGWSRSQVRIGVN